MIVTREDDLSPSSSDKNKNICRYSVYQLHVHFHVMAPNYAEGYFYTSLTFLTFCDEIHKTLVMILRLSLLQARTCCVYMYVYIYIYIYIV
jgi:hypothetical protein